MATLKFKTFSLEHKKEWNKYIGIDQSLTNTGITFIKDDDIIYSKGIPTNSQNSLESRMVRIKNEIKLVMEEYNPNAIAIEGLAYSANTNNGRLLAGLFFTIITFLHEVGIPYFIIAPKTLKKFATGNGSANKPEMLNSLLNEEAERLSKLSGKKITSKAFEDIVDSYYLARYLKELE